MNSMQPTTFTAVVLAGERNDDDPLLRQTGAACKALLEIDGTAMVLRVLETLAKAEHIGQRILSGPRKDQLDSSPRVRELIENGEITWQEPQSTPSTSAYQVMQSVPPQTPVLVTTADHPLLSAQVVDEFCRQSHAEGLDVAVALAPYELVQKAFPGLKKTVLRFKDGNYCGCNLYAFLTPRSRRVADYWKKVERERKNPLKVIRALGWKSVIQYLLGTLSLQGAMQGLSKQLDLRAGAIILPYAEAAVDVDSVSDHAIVQNRLSKTASSRET